MSGGEDTSAVGGSWPVTPAARAGGIERWLRPIAEVRPGETGLVLLLALDVFLILTAYYVLKTIREPLILLSGTRRISGPELKTYASAGQALLLLALVPIYGRL